MDGDIVGGRRVPALCDLELKWEYKWRSGYPKELRAKQKWSDRIILIRAVLKTQEVRQCSLYDGIAFWQLRQDGMVAVAGQKLSSLDQLRNYISKSLGGPEGAAFMTYILVERPPDFVSPVKEPRRIDWKVDLVQGGSYSEAVGTQRLLPLESSSIGSNRGNIMPRLQGVGSSLDALNQVTLPGLGTKTLLTPVHGQTPLRLGGVTGFHGSSNAAVIGGETMHGSAPAFDAISNGLTTPPWGRASLLLSNSLARLRPGSGVDKSNYSQAGAGVVGDIGGGGLGLGLPISAVEGASGGISRAQSGPSTAVHGPVNMHSNYIVEPRACGTAEHVHPVATAGVRQPAAAAITPVGAMQLVAALALVRAMQPIAAMVPAGDMQPVTAAAPVVEAMQPVAATAPAGDMQPITAAAPVVEAMQLMEHGTTAPRHHCTAPATAPAGAAQQVTPVPSTPAMNVDSGIKPSKPPSAYQRFYAANCKRAAEWGATCSREYPKILALRWKLLTAEEQKPYLQAYEADMRSYEQAKQDAGLPGVRRKKQKA
ncbi:hypothetical protein Vretimale_324 [Volvox reticuliferus]|nr:hypothetical protein Vretifemale_2575 [Volvox reticuliferus]GIL94156.1 hypothetical protein Vretimale_324 [Volvox reticuliferus]